MSTKKTMEVMSPARVPKATVSKEATRDPLRLPHVDKDTSSAKKVRPQANIVRY